MSENTENQNEQMAETQENENPFQWEFKDKKYDLMLVNGTGGIGLPILDVEKRERVIGIIGAYFLWENAEAFLDHLDQETIDKARNNDDWTKRENDSMIQKNAELFVELVQSGYSQDIDEFGNRSEEKKKSRDQMLAYRKPLQSDLINHWLNKQVHVERHLPKGFSGVDALLSNVSEIFFTLKVGDYDNPRHILLFEFDAPTDDAISKYQSDTYERGQNQNQDWRFKRDNVKRLKFAKQYFRSVKGIMLGPKNELDVPAEHLEFYDNNNEDHKSRFKKLFNTEWFIRLGEELASVFNLGK